MGRGKGKSGEKGKKGKKGKGRKSIQLENRQLDLAALFGPGAGAAAAGGLFSGGFDFNSFLSGGGKNSGKGGKGGKGGKEGKGGKVGKGGSFFNNFLSGGKGGKGGKGRR